MDKVSFFSEGVRLDGNLFRPDSARFPGDRPGVVLCHGYTGTRDLYLPDAARALAADGFVALTFDYKGWGTSDGPTRRLDPYGRVADLQAATTYLTLQTGVDVQRIGLFGWSFGGATAIWSAAHDRRVKAVVSAVGVGDGPVWYRSVRSDAEWQDAMKLADEDRIARLTTGVSRMTERARILWLDEESKRISAASRAGTTASAATDIPAEFIDETMNFRPQWVVDKVAPAALLLIATDGDLVVPKAEAERLYAAANEPKRLVTLEGFGHYAVYSGEAFRQTMAATLAWLGEHLCA
ncbi:MAG TPA: alpha/beta fold hydrolase [Rhabdaerophilum sp.]|nr:alpha/beta fold hydrolase [Rhabdaerophilum sp.]